ncbi:hypothetical protein GFY24_12945 [Nocardia sp. SYP-A9097]|nr:hypothetical protein [Nocardia sp. SYP-A9097]
MEVVVALVIAWAMGKARRVGKRVDDLTGEALDATVDRVWEVVARKLGAAPSIQQLVSQAKETGDATPKVRAEAQRALAEAAATYPEFEAELQAAREQDRPPHTTIITQTGTASRGSVGPINATGPVTVSTSNVEKTINKWVTRAAYAVEQNPRTAIFGGIALLVIIVVVASCVATGFDENRSAPSTTVAPASVAASTVSIASTTPTRTTTATPAHGLLTQAIAQDRHSIEYGVVDLTSGNYIPFKKFTTSTATFWDPLHDVSPDWKLMGASATVGRENHAGWVDDSGQFTDVTALILKNSPAKPDFSRPINQSAIGFDSAGALYLEDATEVKSTGGGVNILKVWPGSPAAVVDTLTTTKGSSWAHSYFWNWHHDLTPIPEDISCSSVRSLNDFIWIDQTRYVTAQVNGNHLLIWNSTSTMCPLETSGEKYESKLLPDESQYTVSDPYVNPAGDTIAFFSDTGNFAGMYTVSVSGGNPTRTGVTSAKLHNHRIVRWI